MRLALIMAKEYPPYSKWLGTAFNKLEIAGQLTPVLENILHGKTWQVRDRYLAQAYSIIAEKHNGLGLTEPLPAQPTQFHQRPFNIIWGGKFVTTLLEKIHDPQINENLRRSPIGSIDILTDNCDLLEDPAFRPALRQLYE
jgi:hypothetical protein